MDTAILNDLRSRGLRVKITHYRVNKSNNQIQPLGDFRHWKTQNLISPYGGFTECSIIADEYTEI